MQWIYVLIDDDDVIELQDQEGLGLDGDLIVYGAPETMYTKRIPVYDFDVENPHWGLPK